MRISMGIFNIWSGDFQPQMDGDWTALTLYGTMVFQPISWDVTPIAMIMY